MTIIAIPDWGLAVIFVLYFVGRWIEYHRVNLEHKLAKMKEGLE